MYNEYQKRQRTTLSNKQTAFLKTYFYHNTFPTKQERDMVARKIDVSSRTVQIWFQNMRQKVKNKCPETETKEDFNKFCDLQLLAETAAEILERKKRHIRIKNENEDKSGKDIFY